MKRSTNKKPLSALSKQMKDKAAKGVKKSKEYDGNTEVMISTGSTLLDLAITGGRVKGGGIPGGILVEIFGPNSAGKTVLLCEIGGDIQRKGGEAKFNDPEARLNKQFARQFDLHIKKEDYSIPDTVTEVFSTVRKWEPENEKVVNGILADSLAALSTDLEMDNEDGDKMGMKRAKEFSEQLRKTCRILTQKNLLMCCSNQIRENTNAGPYAEKYTAPGGHALGFYSSLRLRAGRPQKIKRKKRIQGKEVTRVIGVETEFEVYKSSIWKPYHKASLTILFDYGIDDVRANLQFIKDHTSNTVYTVLGRKLSNSIDEAITIIEDEGLESKLKFETIELWEAVESKFESERKPKKR